MPLQRFDISALQPALANGALILTPNHRTRDAILSAYASHCKESVWRSPRVMAIDIWLRELWESLASQGLEPFSQLQLMHSSEESLCWISIVEQSLARIPLLNPDETAALLSHSYQLTRQWLTEDGDLAALANYRAIPDIAAFLDWQSMYESQSRDTGLLGLTDAVRQLIKGLEKGALPIAGPVVLVNFFQSPPLYDKLFNLLGQHCDVKQISCNTDKTPAVVLRHEYVNLDGEIDACARWAMKLIAVSADAHIGVVCGSDAAMVSKINQTFAARSAASKIFQPRAARHLNQQGSSPAFAEHPLLHTLLQLLTLNFESQDSRVVSQLLQSSSLIGFEAEREARIQLDLQLRDSVAPQVSVSELLWQMGNKAKPWHCPMLLTALLEFRTLGRSANKPQRAAFWADLFAKQLHILGWPGEVLSSEEAQIEAQWLETLQQFADADVVLGAMPLATAFARLRSHCQNTVQTQQFDPRCQLSLYRPDEAAGMAFTHLWILGMDDRSWPAAANPTPFLPYSLQKDFAIPGSSSQLQLERSTQLLGLLGKSCSGELIFSHHCLEDDRKLRPSSLIGKIPVTESTVQTRFPVNEHARVLQQADALELVADCSFVPLLASETPKGGSSILSKQSSCPFRAFASHRLNVTALAEFTPGLSPIARGSAVHKALEFFWRSTPSLAALQALDESQTKSAISAAAKVAVEYLSAHYKEVMTPHFKQLELQRIEQLLDNFMREEMRRSAFEIVATEQRFNWQTQNLVLSLSVDRIDKQADGSLALIDYKSGKASYTYNWLDERPQDLQLPFYHHVVAQQLKEPISSVLIAHVNIANTGFSGVTEQQDFHPDLTRFSAAKNQTLSWPELQARWADTVKHMAAEFTQGRCDVSPTSRMQSCQYCGLQALCRINEAAGEMSEDDL